MYATPRTPSRDRGELLAEDLLARSLRYQLADVAAGYRQLRAEPTPLIDDRTRELLDGVVTRLDARTVAKVGA